jgi:Protein of unknown function (DUF4446)
MSDLDALVSANIGPIVGLLVVAVAILAGVLLVVARRAARLEARLAALTPGDDGTSLAGVLEGHLEIVHAVSRRQAELEARAAALEERARHSLAGISLVRFNNFDDTGGNQSFALAMADQEANGVVLSSLHARNQTRVYGKAVARGVAEGALSAEESAALREATDRALGR